jgi:hypothetical protein
MAINPIVELQSLAFVRAELAVQRRSFAGFVEGMKAVQLDIAARIDETLAPLLAEFAAADARISNALDEVVITDADRVTFAAKVEAEARPPKFVPAKGDVAVDTRVARVVKT